MRYLQTTHQKKSAAITTAFMALVVFLLFSFGMKYQDPPEEYGVAINFGTSDVGSGPPIVQETVQSQPQESNPVQETQASPVAKVNENVLTQADADAPVIPKKEVKKKQETLKPIIEKPVEKAVVKEAPKPSKETQNALANLLNGSKSSGEDTRGEGDDNQSGLKGKTNGDPSSSKYYGNGGNGGDGNYSLSGRKPVSKPIIKPDCNEEGIVVVRIEVDKNGKVIAATPGIKGSTNTAACLLAPAKQAALLTRWNSDSEAPVKQVGSIIYKFSLTD